MYFCSKNVAVMSLEDLGSSVGGRRATETSRDDDLSSNDEDVPASLVSNEEEEGDSASAGSEVVVAQPPKLSGKDTGLRELALTGSAALDELDQVSASLAVHTKSILNILLSLHVLFHFNV